MWEFSKHALHRLDERGYPRRLILKVLQEELPSIVLSSPREETVDLYFSMIDSMYVLIVVDRVSKTVVTVRPMRKKEKSAFIEEMENEE